MPLRKLFGISHEKQTKIFKALVNTLFQLHKHVYRYKNINFPKGQYIIALWHAHQCGIYSIENRNKLNIMISRSKDGDMVAYATEHLGIKTVRGSNTRGGATALLELIERIKNGENGAITIDGPRGPKHVAKKGIVEIAKLTGVPIVPMTWYCGKFGFFRFKTWDDFCYPIPLAKGINLYGEPIYVPKDATDEQAEFYRKKVEDDLKALYDKAVSEYDKLK